MSESKRVLRFVYVPDDGAVPRLETRQASVPAADHGAILERRPVLVSPGKHLQTNHCRGRSLQPLLQASRKKGGGGYKTYDVVSSACVTVLHANHIYHALASSGASPMNDNVRALLPGSHVPRTDHHLYLDHRFLLMV